MRIPISILVLTLLASTTGLAANYLPLDEGNSWNFSSPTHPTLAEEWSMLPDVDGLRHHARFYTENGVVTFEHHWLLERLEGGTILFHAQIIPGDTEFTYFNPPARLVQAPLAAGLSWVDEFALGETGAMLRMESTCVEEGMVTVPAGDFYAHRVSRTVYVNGDCLYETHEWFCENQGVVKGLFR